MDRKSIAYYAECPGCGYKNWKLAENSNDYIECYKCGEEVYSEEFIENQLRCDINKTQLLCFSWDDIIYLQNLGVHVHDDTNAAPIRNITNTYVTFQKLDNLRTSYARSVLDKVYIGGKHNNLLTEQTFLGIQ